MKDERVGRMTEEELNEIEERAEEATPGPWWFIAQGYPLLVSAHEEIGPSKGPPVCRMVRTDSREWGWMAKSPPPREIADALFIAHARDDVPALVREVRALRRVLAEKI